MMAVIQGLSPVSLALTEKDHGSDLVASDVLVVNKKAQYQLDGEKWLINNASRSRVLSVLATIDASKASRGHVVVMFDKASMPADAYQPLDKIRTHGVRGADISGIRFMSACVDKKMCIGNEGDGLEIVLKSLQISRTLCAALSLGAADTALRTTLKFALNRRLYGDVIINIPHVKQTLVECYLQLLICELIAEVVSRSIHIMPEQMSVYSSVAKYYIPTMLTGVIEKLATILGARHYLREEHDAGVFQKLFRDHDLVGLFDGSTIVNMQNISSQLPYLMKKFLKKPTDVNVDLFDFDVSTASFDLNRLKISNSGKDSLFSSLTVDKWGEKYPLLQALCKEQKQFAEKIVSSDEYNKKLNQAIESDVKKYCHFIAASCVTNVFISHAYDERLFEALIYQVQSNMLGELNHHLDESYVMKKMVDQYENNALFSLHKVALG